MASPPQITVDKAYFCDLLRRATSHARASQYSSSDTEDDILVAREDFDALFQLAREYEVLKQALYQGGVGWETIHILVASAREPIQRKDSAVFDQPSSAACQDPIWSRSQAHACAAQCQHDRSWSSSDQSNLQTSNLQRHSSYGMEESSTSLLDDSDDLDGDESFAHGSSPSFTNGSAAAQSSNDKSLRTIYFSGLPDSTSYSDLLSVVKGGKLVCVNMPSERSATISFLDPEAASKYLSWAKKNDIYIKNKRIEVRWAERHFTINSHIVNKIQNGATRNLVISNAQEKGLTERQIRDDMDHIHGLVITNVSFRQGDAYVSMNSIHNALFARTCMLSRTAYKGCKVQFMRDECDIPLPERKQPANVPAAKVTMAKKRHGTLANRFDLLNMDGTESDSDGTGNQASEIDSESDVS